MNFLKQINENVRTDDIEGMYGWVEFEDGSDIDLEATGRKKVEKLLKALKKKQGIKVTNIGEKDIGDEAHWYVVRKNGHSVFGNKKAVQGFIDKL